MTVDEAEIQRTEIAQQIQDIEFQLGQRRNMPEHEEWRGRARTALRVKQRRLADLKVFIARATQHPRNQVQDVGATPLLRELRNMVDTLISDGVVLTPEEASVLERVNIHLGSAL